MPRIHYQTCNFRRSSRDIIDKANTIIAEYAGMGFRLTLRQLYYQFVSRDWLPNRQKEYKRLGSIINDARLAGMIDWNAIEDRGRNLLYLSTWTSPSSIIATCADQFRYDLWDSQSNYVEVWIEKEALIGVVGVPCSTWRVPHFACKGYTSQSEMWDAGYNRLRREVQAGKEVTIIHLGDHDPSGIDMTRDIRDRLQMFVGAPVEILRIALNMDQVKEYNPPPNPAKMTDSRFGGYSDLYSDESWELDALSPEVIAGLIEKEVLERLDMEQWQEDLYREEKAKATLKDIADNYDEVETYLANIKEDE